MPIFTFDVLNLFSGALVIFGIQVAFFIFAVILKTDKVTDLSYSLTFVIMSLLLLFSREHPVGVPHVVVTVFIVLWGFRLGTYLFSRIIKMKKDDRFEGIRENPVSFAAFWLLQAVTIWIVMLPTIVLLSMEAGSTTRFFTWAGAVLWIIGFSIEAIADAQKHRFRNNPANRGKWIQHGLWKNSRHPNYFGEMLCWWAIFVITVPYLQGWQWATIIGPAFLTLMLIKVSGVPTVEKKAEEKYGDNPEYWEYKRNTNTIIPLAIKRDR